MNCQDISRIADSGRINGLGDTERRVAEAHALTCRSCAAVWGAHTRLAELPVPSMPAELRLRCQTMVMLPAAAPGARSARHLILLGSLVGLAAAAAVLLMNRESAKAPGSASSAAVTLAPSTTLATSVDVPRVTATTEALEVGIPEASEDVVQAQLSALPLLPKPIETDKEAMGDLALQKLVQRHPDLTQGPDLQGNSFFLAVIVMRPGGDVISSAVRLPTGINAYELDHELYRTLPTDGGETLHVGRKKHYTVPDGRSLRGDLNFRVVVLPPSYNTSRSTTRVREILGHRYNHLLLPSAGPSLNRLTILLAADGSILREHVDAESQEITFTETRSDDPKDVARVAEERAKRMGVDVDQIGLMGTTRIEDGTIKLVADGSPSGFVDDKRRELLVSYAWQRGAGESSPTLRQEGARKPPVDLAVALAIVEQHIPEAFTRRAIGAETFMVVLTTDGRVMRTGRVMMDTGVPMPNQLVPGVRTTPLTTLRLTNKTGATADVRFAWEKQDSD